MSNTFLDAAISIDGFWADRDGKSVYPVEEMHRSRLIEPIIARTGAVVMSAASFAMAADPDSYADSYEFQVPIFIVTDAGPRVPPRENGRISFRFLRTYDEALRAARAACDDRDVIVIAEASASQAVLAKDQVDEIFLRIVPRILGEGIPLFGSSAPAATFRRLGVETSETVTHLHLVRDTHA
jgi:riboflavin biosynthesis pyrimidine reductase